jgi:hypothetical protein
MIPDLNIFSSVSRSLVVAGRTVVVMDDFSGGRFMSHLQPPVRSRTSDGSPRDEAPYMLRWRVGLLGPQEVPQAGWRVSLTRPTSRRTYENAIYELLGDPREIRNGANSTGMQAEVAMVADLYPYAATLKEQGGATVSSIIVSLWSEREDHASTGTYEEFSGEAPAEYSSSVKVNRKLDIDGEIYRITSSILDLEGPRVKFTARRANA